MSATPTTDLTSTPAAGHGPGRAVLLSPRTVLVSLGTVRAALGSDSEAVLGKVDDGSLRWVFNVGLGQRRTLRFWAVELTSPGLTSQLNLDQAIQIILGRGTSLARGEIERAWSVSHVTVGRWIASQGVQLAAPGRISLPSLSKFLAGRWQGSNSVAAVCDRRPPPPVAALCERRPQTGRTA